MTGIPHFNFPAFDSAAAKLREQGVKIISPCELDDAETRAYSMSSPDGKPGSESGCGYTWGDFLSRDIKIIVDKCDGICFLPGWERSKGARLEAYVSLICNHKFYAYDEKYSDHMIDLHKHEVIGIIRHSLF